MRKTMPALVAGLCLVLAELAVPGSAAVAAPRVASPLRRVRTIDAPLSANDSTTGTFEPYSSPAVGDITGDGRPEIVTASLDGVVTAYSASTGETVWQQAISRRAIHTSPVLADMDGDDVADVVVGSMDAHVYWLDGPTGRIVRTFAEGPVLHCPAGLDCRPHGFFATPAVVDITGDGKPEIIAPSWDHTIYAWQGDGRLVFRTYLEDTLWSSPAVVDIDGNGTKEIVFGGDIWPGNPFHVPPGGLLWVLQANGRPYRGYPRSFPGQVIWSSPAVVDLDGDGKLDAVFGTGTHDPFGDVPADRKLYAVTLTTGRAVRGWPVQLKGRAPNAPSVGDLDGDGRPDVSIGSEGGYVYAFRSDGFPLWRNCAVVGGSCGPSYFTHGSSVIADVDDDGSQEVIAALDKFLYVYDGKTGAVEASFRLTDGHTYRPASVPVVAPGPGGKANIVLQTVWQPSGHSGAPEAGDITRTYQLSTGQDLCRADWPMFKRTVNRTSAIPAAGLPFRPFDCAAPFVAQQYRDFLGRPLDGAGSAFWSARMATGSWPGARVIQSFMDSNEFGRVRAPLVRAQLAITGGPPSDAAAFKDLADRFRTGSALGDLADVVLGGSGSVDRDGAAVADKSDATFVADAYRYVFGRAATPAEQAAGEAAVAAGTRGRWIAAFTSTPEAAERLVPEVYVTMSYLGMLGRPPDAGGYAYWVPSVRSGRTIQGLIGSFQRTTEYARRVLG